MSRRAVTCGALALPAALAMDALTPIAAFAAVGPYSRSTWKPWVGRDFVLVKNGKRVRARLSAIEDLTGAKRGAEHRFSLEFTAGRLLPDGTVTIRRAGFKPAVLFVTSVDRGHFAQHCQAVINRI